MANPLYFPYTVPNPFSDPVVTNVVLMDNSEKFNYPLLFGAVVVSPGFRPVSAATHLAPFPAVVLAIVYEQPSAFL